MDKELLTCSFCGVSSLEQRLVTAGESTNVCSRCVEKFKLILEQSSKNFILLCSFCLNLAGKAAGNGKNHVIICERCAKNAKVSIRKSS